MHRFIGGQVPPQLVWVTLAAAGAGVALAAAARSPSMHDLLAEE